MAERSSAIFWVLNCPIYLLRCHTAIAARLIAKRYKQKVGAKDEITL